ncbi:MAG: hypothetical protein AAFY80_15140 [Pseudomonadota bacterium]
MSEEYPNVTLLIQLNLADPEASGEVLSEHFVWHRINPNLTDMEGD